MLGAAGASWWPGWEQVTRAGSGHRGLVLAALELQEVGGKEVREAQDGGSPKGLRLLAPQALQVGERKGQCVLATLRHRLSHTHARTRADSCMHLLLLCLGFVPSLPAAAAQCPARPAGPVDISSPLPGSSSLDEGTFPSPKPADSLLPRQPVDSSLGCQLHPAVGVIESVRQE